MATKKAAKKTAKKAAKKPAKKAAKKTVKKAAEEDREEGQEGCKEGQEVVSRELRSAHRLPSGSRCGIPARVRGIALRARTGMRRR